MIYLLDTNILVIYIRDNEVTEFIDKKFTPLKKEFSPSISVVSYGELKSLAIQNNWGKRKLEDLDKLVKEVLVIDINSTDILNEYAEIDAFSQGRLNNRVSNFTARNMGKNDLWIAATASVLEATLLTTDNDFDHLHEEFFEVEKVSINI